jgi:hypothetical protein
MKSTSRLAFVTLVSAASATMGCYSTWDLTPHAVLKLNGFREGEEVTVPTTNHDEVDFTSSTTLIFHRIDGATREHRFRSIVIDGPQFMGMDIDNDSRIGIDLSLLKGVQARNLSAGKTAALTTGIVLGTGAVLGTMLAIVAMNSVVEGRPLRESGRDKPILAPLAFGRRKPRPLQRHLSPHVDEATRHRVFAHWAKNTSSECASIPAFVALAEDLRKAAAPENLIRAALRAAREEATHTALCANLANTHADMPIMASTPATPQHTDETVNALLERLALEAFWDGCVNEGAAATIASRAAHDTQDIATRLAQQTIAKDETGHALLSRDILAFCLSTGGRSVRNALGESFERRRASEEASLSGNIDGSSDEAKVDEDFLTHYGVPSDELIQAARVETWEKNRGLVAQI